MLLLNLMFMLNGNTLPITLMGQEFYYLYLAFDHYLYRIARIPYAGIFA